MKKILSLMTVLLCAVTWVWAQDEPTLDVEFKSSTISDYLKEYSDLGIKLSGSGSLSSSNGDYSYRGCSGQPTSVNSNYLGIDATTNIEKVAFKVSPNSTGSSVKPVLVGWTEEPELTNVAFYTTQSGTVTNSTDKANAEWLTYDLSSVDNIKYVRIYRKITKNTFKTVDGESIGEQGVGVTPRIWEVKVWLKGAADPVATEKTIYLNPGVWAQDVERFAVLAFDNNAGTNEWYSMSKDAEDDYYSVAIPEAWPNILFARVDKNATDYVWEGDSKTIWNQTDDIDFTNTVDGTIFTITGWGDEKSPYSTSLNITSMVALGDVVGSWEIADGWAMTQSTEDVDVWTYSKENVTLSVGSYNFKSVANGAWGVCDVPATSGENYVLGISEKGIYTISITVNTNTKVMSVEATKTANAPIETLTIVGTFLGKTGDDNWKFENGWAMTQEEATMGSESTIWTLTKENVDLKAGTYEYKVVANNDWDDQQWPASGNNTVEIEETGVYNLEFLLNTAIGSDNLTLNANKVGDYEPAWTYSVAGNGFLGNWDKTYDMTDADADGIYTWTTAQENLSGSVEFKVIKKDAKGIVDNVWCPSGDNITITFDETYNYTITFSINSATDEVSYTCEKREYPEYAANNVYFWESPDGIVNQNGGTAVHNNNERVNYANSGYYTICLNGKNDFSSDIITIALDHALKAGDQISITAYRTKDSNSGAKLKFGDNTTYTTVGDKTGFVNISNGDKPNTLTVEAPALAEGCKTITLTRSQTGTNLFVTKIEITRPNITHTATFTTNKGWEEVAAYVWSGEDSNKVLGEWPGTVLEADAEGVYTVTIEALEAPEHIIFNNNDNGQQTADLVFENGKAYSYNSLTLASTADNTAAIDENDGNTADVTLEGVTLYKDGLWFTLCLPFDVTDFTDTPLADATVHAMDAANSNLSDGTLTLNFVTGIGSIEAGKPYIVKWNDGTDIENPEFKNVTIKKDAPVAVEGSKVSFVGTYAQMASVTDANKLFLGVDGTQSALYTPAAADLGAFRAYFNVEGASQVRQFVLNFDGETTGIGASLMNSERVNNAVYNLNGQRVAQPSKGLYIVNGRKVVIK